MTKGRVVLIGAVHESLDALRAIARHPEAELVCVVTLDDRAGAEVSGLVDLAGEAVDRGIDVLRVANANDPEVVARIRAYKPEVVVVVGWTRLIHDELLALPSRGCVGFHASLLPRHRGRAPVNWSIIHGETETGNTMMLLNAGVDTGMIVDQRSTPIDKRDTCGTVYERVAALGAHMLSDNLGPLLRGEIEPRAQDDSLADVLPKRVPDMGVTDWRRGAEEVHDWIRAQTHPYPGAFALLGEDRIPLWASEPPSSEDLGLASENDIPGLILDINDEAVCVATGRGSIKITSLGSPPMGPMEWATATEIDVGRRFRLPSEGWAAWALGKGPRPSDEEMCSA